jgi:hypothetical protein
MSDDDEESNLKAFSLNTELSSKTIPSLLYKQKWDGFFHAKSNK